MKKALEKQIELQCPECGLYKFEIVEENRYKCENCESVATYDEILRFNEFRINLAKENLGQQALKRSLDEIVKLLK